MLRRFETGEKLVDIEKVLGLATSTVGTIRDNEDKIKSQSQSAGALNSAKITRHRSTEMENGKTAEYLD